RWDTICELRPRFGFGSNVDPFGADANGRVAFHGYLFDRDQLSVSGSASDATLVAAAYERWRRAVFDKLRGGFAIAIWDEERRCLLVGRDAMGLIPCFYWWNGRLLVVSPSMDAIVSQPEVSGRFNRVLIAEYLQTQRAFQQIGETLYEDVPRLPAAHTMSVRDSTLSLTRYWDPVPPGFAWATDQDLSYFTSVLGTAVDRALAAGADSLALSGGFDSVSIAVMAAERRRGGAPLHAVSLRFSHPSCDESSRQGQVANALGMPQLMRSLDEFLDDNSFAGELRELSRLSPGPIMSAWQPMYVRLLKCASELGLRHVLTGTGGDEMYYVNMGYAADCLAAFDLRGLWRFFRACDATWPGAPPRVAPLVFWDAALQPPVVQLGRAFLDPTSPATPGRSPPRRSGPAAPPGPA